MEAIAKRSHIRTSPRKLRLVADVVRGMEADRALTQLQFSPQRAADALSLVLKQAIANAHQLGMTSNLVVKAIQIDEGPIYRRWQAVSRGQAHGIDKKTSHIKITIAVRQPKASKATAKAAASKTDAKPATDQKTTKSEAKKSTTKKKTTKSKSTKK